MAATDPRGTARAASGVVGVAGALAVALLLVEGVSAAGFGDAGALAAWAVAMVAPIVVAGAVLALAWGLGRWVVSLALGDRSPERRLRRVAHLLAVAVGLSLLAWLVLAMGTIGWVRPGPLTAVFVALSIAVLVRERRGTAGRAAGRAAGGVPTPRRPRLPIGAAVVASLFVVPFAIGALTPPAAYDVLEYHLAGPLAWLDAGSLAPIRGNFYTALPSALEAAYTLILGLRGGEPGFLAAKVLHGTLLALWLVGSMALFGIVGVRHHGVRLGGALLLLAFVPTFETATDANNDLAVAILYLLAFVAVTARRPNGLLCGALVGLGAGFKFTMFSIGLVPLSAVGAVFALRVWVGGPRVPSDPLYAKSWVLLFILGCVAAYVPWALRAWWYTTYPAFPATGWSIPSPGGAGSSATWSEMLAREYASVHLVCLPWKGGDYWEQWCTRLAQWGWGYLFALAAGVVAAVVRWRAGRRHGALVVAAAASAAFAGTAAWSILGTSPMRFLLPIMPLTVACLLAAISDALRAVPTTAGVPLARRRACTLVVALLLLAALPRLLSMVLAVDQFDMAAAALKQSSPQEYRNQFLQGWDGAPILDHLVDALGPDAAAPEPVRVFCLYEARTAHLPVPAMTVTVHDAYPPEWGSLAGLRAAGFTHLLVNELELERLREFYPVRPADRAARIGAPVGRPVPGTPRATPGTVEFYADWLPWSGPAARKAFDDTMPPPLAAELPAARRAATVTTGDLTRAGHRLWVIDLRAYQPPS